MIAVSSVGKTYRGFDVDRQEWGIGSWIKNASRLTSNRAAPVRALQGVSFEVGRGELFGIFGSNGAGKTTLVKILSGLLLPDEGSVRVNGQSGLNRIKEQIGYVSTNGWMGLEWQLTVLENLVLYGHIFGVPRATLRKRCDAALELFDMAWARDRHVSQLSAGMRQKVTLMRGILLERPILYLDEPTVSLDVQSSAALREILRDDVARQGRTVLVTSHNPADLDICQRIMFLHRGQVIALGSKEQLMRPLEGIAALHIACSAGQGGQLMDRLGDELRLIGGVREVWIGAADGKRQTWQVRLLLRHRGPSTGEIVDLFIRHRIPIVAMQMKELTLHELYAHYLGTAGDGKTQE